MHVKFGEYHVNDIEFVAAFDVDAKKVGFDLSEATQASENNTIKIADVAADRRDRPEGPHARRSRQVLPRDHRGVRRRAGRRRPGPQGHPGRRARLLPARGLGGGRQVLRAVRDRREGRLRQRPARLHRVRPRVGQEVRGRRRPDHRRRHQEPGRRDHHAPRHGQAVRGPRRRARPHVPAQRRRQHGLQEHARARASGVQEGLQDAGRHLEPAPARWPARSTTRTSTSARRTTSRGSTTASGRTSASRVARSATSPSTWSTSSRSGTRRTRPASSSTPSARRRSPRTAASAAPCCRPRRT